MTEFNMTAAGWYEPTDHDCPESPEVCQCQEVYEQMMEAALLLKGEDR